MTRSDYVLYRDGKMWKSTPSATQATDWAIKSLGLYDVVRIERITATETTIYHTYYSTPCRMIN